MTSSARPRRPDRQLPRGEPRRPDHGHRRRPRRRGPRTHQRGRTSSTPVRASSATSAAAEDAVSLTFRHRLLGVVLHLDDRLLDGRVDGLDRLLGGDTDLAGGRFELQVGRCRGPDAARGSSTAAGWQRAGRHRRRRDGCHGIALVPRRASWGPAGPVRRPPSLVARASAVGRLVDVTVLGPHHRIPDLFGGLRALTRTLRCLTSCRRHCPWPPSPNPGRRRSCAA